MPRLSIGLEQIFTNLGIVGAGYKLYFFETGTSTPKTTYSDENLSIANTNPVVLDAAGRAQVGIWGSDPSLYRMVLGDPDSTIGTVLSDPVVDVDPVDNYSVNNIANLNPIPTAFWGTTTGTSTAYVLNPALVDITSYSNTQTFFIEFHIACAAAPTININGLGALNLLKRTGQGTTVALLDGDIQPGRHICTNNGSAIIVMDPRTLITYLGAPPTLNVSNNILTHTNAGSSYNVNTSGAAQTINTINGLANGQIAVIGISSASNGATFNNGAGNVVNPDGTVITLSSLTQKITVYYDGINNNAIVINYPAVCATGNSLLYFQSAAQTITLAGTLTIAHGLGVAPTNYQAILKCTSADGNYTAGDETEPHDSDRNDNGPGYGVQLVIPNADTTNIYVRFGNTAIVILNKTTGAAHTIDVTKWQLIVRAWRR